MDTSTPSSSSPSRSRRVAVSGILAVVAFAAGVGTTAILTSGGEMVATAPTTSTTADDTARTRASRGIPGETTPSTSSAPEDEGDDTAGVLDSTIEDGPHPTDPAHPPASPAPAPPSPTSPDPGPGPSTTTTTVVEIVPPEWEDDDDEPGPSLPAPSTPAPSTPTPGPAPSGPSLGIAKIPSGILMPTLDHPSSINLGAAFVTAVHITNPGLVPVTWTPGPASPGVYWSTQGGTIQPGSGMTVQLHAPPAVGSWSASASIRYGGVDHPISLVGVYLGPGAGPGVQIPGF